MSALNTAGAVLMVLGTILSFLAAWGVLDFPSPLSRMHAATKTASLGLGLLAAGAGLAAGSWSLLGVSVLVAVFLFMTAPISGHVLGRAAYAAGQVDDLVHDDLAGVSPSGSTLAGPTTGRFSVLRVLPLIAIWVLLWRDLSMGTVLGGAVVGGVVELVRRVDNPRSASVLGMIRFFAHYARIVVASNVRVAREVITPDNDNIIEAIVAVPLKTTSMQTALLVANAISSAPGSLTIELTGEPLVLYVHVLHFESVAEVERDVAVLESLASRAFPDRNGGSAVHH